jgi:heme-degrading monooxygenase HmoA
MYARVTQYRVKPGKSDDFVAALSASIPLMHDQRGFVALLVMRNPGINSPDLRVLTVWDSEEELLASERNLYFYQAVSRALEFSDGFPSIREEEIVLSDFPD